MNRNTVVAVIAAVAVTVFVTDRCYSGQMDEWEKRVERVQEQSRQDRERAREAIARADSAEDAAKDAAMESEEDQDARSVEIRYVRDETPPEISEHPAVVARDEIIDEQSEIIAETRSVLETDTLPDLGDIRSPLARAAFHRRMETLHAREATEVALARGDSLSNVLKDRPKGRPWYIPRLGLGVATGINDDGEPETVAGATLSWDINL